MANMIIYRLGILDSRLIKKIEKLSRRHVQPTLIKVLCHEQQVQTTYTLSCLRIDTVAKVF